MYLDLSVWDGVFPEARSVEGDPVLVAVQVHCLYPPRVEPTLLLRVQSGCSGWVGGEGGVCIYVH